MKSALVKGFDRVDIKVLVILCLLLSVVNYITLLQLTDRKFFRGEEDAVQLTDPLDHAHMVRWRRITVGSDVTLTSHVNTSHRDTGVLARPDRLDLCPFRPPNLKNGSFPPNQTAVTLEELNRKYAFMKPGGWRPTCRVTQRLAIIVPYRNRRQHLHVFLNNIIPLLVRQQADFTIFVIEQLPPTVFNRGMLFNVGFLEATKTGNYDCFVFHDVDMLPSNDHCLYRCSSHPVHLTAGISKWKYSVPYNKFFGAVVAFRKQQWLEINGASNMFFGWGGEDDDLYIRVVSKKYKTLRYRADVGVYETFKHGKDEGNEENEDRDALLSSTVDRQDVEGLSTTVYQLKGREERGLYTWVRVFIDVQNVFQTLPKFILRKIPNIRKMVRRLKDEELSM